MTAEILLATLRDRGVTLVAIGDRLWYRPAALVTDEERAALVRCRDAVLDHLRAEEEDVIAAAVEVLGARIVYRTPPGLRCGRCGGGEWRPAPARAGEVICQRCWWRDGMTLRPFAEVVLPSSCPSCGGPAWHVCGTWRCARCEPPAQTTRSTAPVPGDEKEREGVGQLAAAADSATVHLASQTRSQPDDKGT